MTETRSLRFDPANAGQAAAWDGEEGTYWAAHADRFDQAIAPHHTQLMAAADVRVPEWVLDIGCGSGQTTLDAARAAAEGVALGVDLSTAMLEVARRHAARDGVLNARFEQADAQVQPFEHATFDLAISRTGAMFFGDPIAAFANIRRSLRNTGRLVLLTWQPLPSNEWIQALSGALAAGRDLPRPGPELPGPFALSDPQRIQAVLHAGGFADVRLDPVHEPMWFGHGADDAQQFVTGLLGWMLDGLDDRARSRALGALGATLAEHETSDGVLFDSAAWLIQARCG